MVGSNLFATDDFQSFTSVTHQIIFNRTEFTGQNLQLKFENRQSRIFKSYFFKFILNMVHINSRRPIFDSGVSILRLIRPHSKLWLLFLSALATVGFIVMPTHVMPTHGWRLTALSQSSKRGMHDKHPRAWKLSHEFLLAPHRCFIIFFFIHKSNKPHLIFILRCKFSKNKI